MDIHGPSAPIHTWRDFFLHLVTITIGILIALSLEVLLEHFHHNSLVHEARANIRSELQENKSDIDGLLGRAPVTESNLKTVLDYAETRLAHQKADIHSLTLAYSFGQISSTSWNTASTVGAVAFMDYDEVKRYTNVYDIQSQFKRLEQRTADQIIDTTTLFASGADPANLTDSELLMLRDDARSSLAYLQAEKQIAKSLSAEYGKVIADMKS